MQIDPHPLIQTHSGEDIQLAFHITDANGNALDISAATASYKIARRAGDAALLTKTGEDGIGFTGHIATVSLNTADLIAAGEAQIGDFWGQLTLTLDGVTLVVAEGPLCVAPIIT